MDDALAKERHGLYVWRGTVDVRQGPRESLHSSSVPDVRDMIRSSVVCPGGVRTGAVGRECP